MQTRHAARLAAETEAAIAFESAHAVLLSPDLCSQQLWRWLDRDSKRALRGVSTALRGLVDGAIEVVASPSEGFSAPELNTTLRLCPGVTHLTLLGVSSDNLQPLATATLVQLTSLTVRQVGGVHGRSMRAWGTLGTFAVCEGSTQAWTPLHGCTRCARHADPSHAYSPRVEAGPGPCVCAGPHAGPTWAVTVPGTSHANA